MRIHIDTPAQRREFARPALHDNWWAVALGGAAALAFGILALLWPGITLLTLVLLLAAYFLVDGLFAIIAGVRAAQLHERWWPFVIEGLAGLAAAALILIWPGPSILALMYLVAVWAIFTGVVMLFGGSAAGAAAPRWLMLLAGALSVLLGVLMIAQPAAGVLVLAWWVGSYAILFGLLLLAFGFWLRGRRHEASAWR